MKAEFSSERQRAGGAGVPRRDLATVPAGVPGQVVGGERSGLAFRATALLRRAEVPISARASRGGPVDAFSVGRGESPCPAAPALLERLLGGAMWAPRGNLRIRTARSAGRCRDEGATHPESISAPPARARPNSQGARRRCSTHRAMTRCEVRASRTRPVSRVATRMRRSGTSRALIRAVRHAWLRVCAALCVRACRAARCACCTRCMRERSLSCGCARTDAHAFSENDASVVQRNASQAAATRDFVSSRYACVDLALGEFASATTEVRSASVGVTCCC
jgi:hypothetical protein